MVLPVLQELVEHQEQVVQTVAQVQAVHLK
jgi:hypothetical protein